ncbi:transglutaminase family protein [Metallumcola ferriviriculae]|uniref:Transglutaminase family protein n=1 Tax=Metallumcola ferriviriculae TaxID=3039180 RepID=A0AAU0UP59_9FIRM|nr:transglutaminase family protein [Desulfitibacteraceae bacterium MK1]
MQTLKEFLKQSEYINSLDTRIIDKAQKLAKSETDPSGVVKRFFYFVRDRIPFDPVEEEIPVRASAVLVFGKGSALGKACLLAALCRAEGIPAGISFQLLKDHKVLTSSKQATEKWHGITSMWLADRWLKLDPSLDRHFALGRKFFAPGFDGINDALLPAKDWQGVDNYEIGETSPVFAGVPNCFIDHNHKTEVEKGVISSVCDNCGLRCSWVTTGQYPGQGHA